MTMAPQVRSMCAGSTSSRTPSSMGHPVRPGHGPGPWEAIEDYLAQAPGLLIHDAAREAKFGATFAVRGYYVRA